MPSLGIPPESAEQIASLLHSNEMISEDDLKSAMVSSEEGEKCLIETLIEYRFTDEKSIATEGIHIVFIGSIFQTRYFFSFFSCETFHASKSKYA